VTCPETGERIASNGYATHANLLADVATLNVPLWLSVSSSLVVALVTIWLTHYFTRAREREKDARDKRRELERDEREQDQNRAVVFAEILELLRVHCAEFGPWLLQMNPQTPAWRASNRELLGRVDNAEARRALGELYFDLMAAIRDEEKTIDFQKERQEKAIPTTSDDHDEKRARADIERFWWYSLMNLTGVLEKYVPLIEALGDAECARELARAATDGRARADRIFREGMT
jgi:hypothetical protein